MDKHTALVQNAGRWRSSHGYCGKPSCYAASNITGICDRHFRRFWLRRAWFWWIVNKVRNLRSSLPEAEFDFTEKTPEMYQWQQ